LIPLEMSLREGQANDALHNLCIHLCNKAILFRTTQMIQLELGPDQLQKYTPLLREQLKISTAIGDPNARGQQNESLAWFWSVEVDMEGPENLWNEE
ncbi:hypothetical protein BDR07DRAFT_1237761, partial [Suillus spraguei]